MARPRWFGMVGGLLVGWLGWSCGGGGEADDVTAVDHASPPVEIIDTTSPDVPWMPLTPVTAEQVFPELTSSEGLAGADGLLLSPDGWLLVASLSKGRVVAYELATGATRVVSDAPAENLRHVASLAFGPGGELDPSCLFATRLNEAGLARICL